MSSNTLYLYTSPFVVAAKSHDQTDYILDHWDDRDRIDYEKIIALVLKFALDKRLITINDNMMIPSKDENMGSWSWMINWLNFRGLIDNDAYAILINALKNNGGDPINEICNLHLRLGVMFDHKLLNTIVHRTMASVQLIPLIARPDSADAWDRIHKEAPFVWLIIFLQSVIHSTVKPLV